MKTEGRKILGVNFFRGTLRDSLELSKQGGLVVAPSGPGMASDLTSCANYAKALNEADLVLPDSGLMCLWQRWFKSDTINRISGLTFLKSFLKNSKNLNETSFWIMPDLEQAKANQLWLSQEMGYCVKDSRIYVAPVYNQLGPIEDGILMKKIYETSPSCIFIQLGGGVQERLGLFLKNNLQYRPTILCTGAAIAFLSGEQAAIPEWADRFYLGWLFRCIFSPKVFIPRYVKAFKLLNLLRKHGHQFPA